MAFYSSIPIIECGEDLVKIPEAFAIRNPHVYASLGAPYVDLSPFYLRSGVLARLELALANLQKQYSAWRIQIFDAYRPVAVQEFMVNYTKQELAKNLRTDLSNPEQEAQLMAQVYKFWAVPSLDPANPPPHSTGAAVDITLVDGEDLEIDMGGAIDEISDRSIPNYYKNATSLEEIRFKHLRQLLKDCMFDAGFQQHPNEWWHFSYGDQMWYCLENSRNPNRPNPPMAMYGRV